MNYHGKMMNIPTRPVDGRWGETRRKSYAEGHRDARHDAADIANEADRTIALLLSALRLAKATIDELNTMYRAKTYPKVFKEINDAIAKGEEAANG